MSAKEKLEANGFSVEHLPIEKADPLWNEMKIAFSLTLGEKAALQAYSRSVCSTSATISTSNFASNEIFVTAKQKLEAGRFSLTALPVEAVDPLWNEMKEEYGLTLGEKAALQAFVRSQNPALSNAASANLASPLSPEPNLIDENFADSPYGNLQGCLENIPDVSTEVAVFGPGPCLLDLMKSVSQKKKEQLRAKIATLRQQTTAMALPSVANVDPDLLLAVKLYTIKDPIELYWYFNRAFYSRAELESAKPFARCMLRAMRALRSTSLFLSPRAASRGMTIGSSKQLQYLF